MHGVLRWYVRDTSPALLSWLFGRMEDFRFTLAHPSTGLAVALTIEGRLSVRPDLVPDLLGGTVATVSTVKIWRDADTGISCSVYHGKIPVIEFDLDGLNERESLNLTGAVLLTANCRPESLALLGDSDLEDTADDWDDFLSGGQREPKAPALFWTRETVRSGSLVLDHRRWFFQV